MFREMKNADTPLAKEVQAVMASGKLVSDDLTYQIVRDRTSREDINGTYLLDVYPRTAVQAEQLEELAREQGKEIEAILVDVPMDDLMRRMTGRRSCPVCGEIYKIYFKRPENDNVCDFHPDMQLQHREDDYQEKVIVRLGTYEQQTKPLIEYYERSGRLKKIDGTGDVESIFRQIEKVI